MSLISHLGEKKSLNNKWNSLKFDNFQYILSNYKECWKNVMEKMQIIYC